MCAFHKVNLYDARKRRSKALSGGMRRRLSVAMATIGDPDVLILGMFTIASWARGKEGPRTETLPNIDDS